MIASRGKDERPSVFKPLPVTPAVAAPRQPDEDLFRPGVYRPLGAADRYVAPARVPGQVTAAAVLEFVVGGFTILASIFFLALGQLVGAFVLLGIVLLAIGGVQIWLGVALRQLHRWARVTAMVLAIVSGLLSLVSVVQGDFVSVLGLGVDVAIFMLLNQRVSAVAFD